MLSTSNDIETWIASLASQLVDADLGKFIFVGIVRGGDVLARRLSNLIEQQTGYPPPVYHIDITLYRDDLYTGLEHPTFGGTYLPISVEGTQIILVDDVLFTGRTIRAAMQEIMDYGRPAWMKLLVLIDRNGQNYQFNQISMGTDYTVRNRPRSKLKSLWMGTKIHWWCKRGSMTNHDSIDWPKDVLGLRGWSKERITKVLDTAVQFRTVSKRAVKRSRHYEVALS